jgi:chemotaxis protein histidine kinase CheA
MTLEQQIKAVIEAATGQLSGHLHERLQALASDVGQAASIEHGRGVEEAVAAVRAEAATQLDAALTAARAEAAGQRELAVSVARAEFAGQHEAALAAARAEAAEQLEAALAAARTQAAEQLESALAAARAEAAEQLDAALTAARAQSAEQRERAVSMARGEAAEQHESALAAARAEAAEQNETALTAARARSAEQRELAISMARAEAAEQLESAVAAAWAQAGEQLESAVSAARAESAQQHDSALAAMRAEAAEQHQSALLAIRAEVADQHEGVLAAARAEAEERLANARADAEQRLANARAQADEDLARRVEAARQEAAQATDLALVDARAAERHAELALAERLADAVRRLDAARSLTDALDVLVDAAGREVSRVAVFLVRGTTLSGWRAAGFSRDDDPRELEIPVDQTGLLSRAVRATSAIATADALSGESNLTPFGSLPSTSAAMAVPLRVGGETVAVLYADDVSSRGHEAPSAWPEGVEVLARHAARCLEVLTVARVTQPLATPASPPAPRLTPQPRGHQAGHDDDDDAARRYARLLVSEIKLYHEAAVTQGRRDRNVLERLRPEIDRARRLYGERVPAPILARTDYFNQELVRTLASGDATLLGQA